MSAPTGDIGLIGLAVMGQNLILNMNDKGYTVVAYNRTVSKVDDFLNNEAKGTNVQGAHSIEELVAKLKRPRKLPLPSSAEARAWPLSLYHCPLFTPPLQPFPRSRSQLEDGRS